MDRDAAIIARQATKLFLDGALAWLPAAFTDRDRA